jgi:hypothetical protein
MPARDRCGILGPRDDAIHPGRFHRAGADGVDSQALTGVICGQRPCQTYNARLRGAVGRPVAKADDPGDGGDVDDDPVTAVQHGGYEEPAEMEHCAQVDSDRHIPIGDQSVSHCACDPDTCVVDEQVG